MNKEDFFYFDLLKKEVASVFLQSNDVSSSLKEWKGEEIVQFQEDLFVNVKARVSEKWFYTYFKNDPVKLPRIDMLNLLSEYVGQNNWSGFKAKHRASLKTTVSLKKKSPYFFLFLVPLLVFAWYSFDDKNEFQFCFVDNLLGEPIIKAPLDIRILNEHESPINIKTDSLGCFRYTTSKKFIKFVVKSPYYKTDTIVRTIENNKNQRVQLSSDDYALILKYYTEGNLVDWRKHKEGLENLIADNALIYKLNGNIVGVELFTKDDFVRLLTIPTSDLRRIKILDKTLREGKIVNLKFIMQ